MSITSKEYFTGKTAVITGSFTEFGRTTLKRILIEAGAKVAGSVSAKTDVLIFGSHAGTKLQKAKDLNIRLLSEQDLKAIIGSPMRRGVLSINTDAALNVAYEVFATRGRESLKRPKYNTSFAITQPTDTDFLVRELAGYKVVYQVAMSKYESTDIEFYETSDLENNFDPNDTIISFKIVGHEPYYSYPWDSTRYFVAFDPARNEDLVAVVGAPEPEPEEPESKPRLLVGGKKLIVDGAEFYTPVEALELGSNGRHLTAEQFLERSKNYFSKAQEAAIRDNWGSQKRK